MAASGLDPAPLQVGRGPGAARFDIGKLRHLDEWGREPDEWNRRKARTVRRRGSSVRRATLRSAFSI